MEEDGRVMKVIELMYKDLMWVDEDKVLKKIGKERKMLGGEREMKVVMRKKVEMGKG